MLSEKEKAFWKYQGTVAYYSGLGGVEIKKIEHGISDYVIAVSGAWSGERKVHRARIHYESARPYFVVRGHRVPLEECIRD